MNRNHQLTLCALKAARKGMPGGIFWKLFIGIIVFLALLAASFYFIWQKQLKLMTQDTFSKE